MLKKRSFFEKITGGMNVNEDEDENFEDEYEKPSHHPRAKSKEIEPVEEEEEDGELTVDVYETPSEIIIKTMVAGVKPDDISVNISRDMVTIKGKREESKTVSEDNYYVQELYWGSFSRTIVLPHEVEPEEAEATEKHGLLTIKLTKIDKQKKSSLKIKSA